MPSISINPEHWYNWLFEYLIRQNGIYVDSKRGKVEGEIDASVSAGAW
jgi:hypothetical protein